MTTLLDLTQITIDQLDQITDLPSLKEWTKDCTACGLRQEASQVVHSSGPLECPIMLVGMNPGFTEDATGYPFAGRQELSESRCVSCKHYTECFDWQTGMGARRPRVALCRGYSPQDPGTPDHIPATTVKAGMYNLGGVISAGQLLDDLMIALGIDRKKLFITNSALCKSAVGEPKPQFVNCCSRIRLRTEKLLDPKVIVAMGNLALGQYTGKKSPMKYTHGIPQTIRDSRILVPTYHPASILRSMLNTSNMTLKEAQSTMADITAQKLAMYDDFTTAFNLLPEADLRTLLLPTKQLENGKLPIRIK